MIRSSCVALLLVVSLPLCALAQAPLVLGKSGQTFTVNGEARFLTFISYFDAMDVDPTSLSLDFAYLRGKGIDGVRIFPNWWHTTVPRPATPSSTTLMNAAGGFRPGRMTKLKQILDTAKAHRLVVDVSFAAETVVDGSDTLTFQEYRTAIVAVAQELSGSAYRHVLFDFQNEGNYVGEFRCAGGGPTCAPLYVPLSSLRNDVAAVDPNRLVTMSIADGSLPYQGEYAQWGDMMDDSGMDVLSFHENRDLNQFWTYPRVKEITAALVWSGDIPRVVYLQEPERWLPSGHADHSGQSVLTAANFRQAVSSAKFAGAAAWCFHTEAGFVLDGTRIENTLAANPEKSFLDTFKAELDAVEWGQLQVGTSSLPTFDGGLKADWIEQQGNALYLFANIGAGGGGPFLPGAPSWPAISALNSYPWRTLIGDFTGDGFADYADYNRETGSFWIHANIGGGFSAANWGHGHVSAELDGSTQILVADLTGDGRADVLELGWFGCVVRVNTGSSGNDDNAFLSSAQYVACGQLQVQWRVLVADFTGDGRADIADWNTEYGAFWIHANTGAGSTVTFSPGDWGYGFPPPHNSYSTPLNAWTVVVGDFTGDGKADFADYQRGSGYMWVHENVGPGLGVGGSAFASANWGYGITSPSRRQAGRPSLVGPTAVP